MDEPPVLTQIDETRVLHRGRRLIYFGGSDYLRMSWHPEVRAAAVAAVAREGLSTCASRLTTGNVPVFEELERALGRLFGVPSVTLTSAGYLAPMALAQAVASEFTVVLLDERAHGCLRDAAVLTGLPVRTFPHRDPEGLGLALRKCGRDARCLVMTDGVFTHSGGVAPLADYLAVLPETARLVVDDAHGVAVLGARGRGSVEWCRIPLSKVWVTATLSKGFGAYGGMILGPRVLRKQLLERSRILMGNTPVVPPLASAALASVAILKREGAARRARLQARVDRVKGALRAAGMPIPEGPGPMFTCSPTSERAQVRLQKLLLAADIYPSLIRYPNGPSPRYFRFALSSEHHDSQWQALEAVLLGFIAKGDV